MNNCPKCGAYLSGRIIYSCGSPIVLQTCSCGYDSSKETFTTSDRTTEWNLNYVATNSSSNY